MEKYNNLIEAYKEEIYENFIDIQAKAKGKWSDRKEMLYKGEKYNIVKEYNEKNIINISLYIININTYCMW